MAIPPPDDGYGDAAVSLWTTRVVAFTQWVGPGRRVTQTGRLTLAQARELVPALDTGDVIDPMVHGRVHRTTSTEELPELNTTCAWAKAARLVRVTGGKLAVVQKNAVLLERPVPLWERMFATFGALGPVICPPGWGESLLRGHFADGIRAVLSGVSAHDGPAGLDLVCRWGWDAVSHGGRIAGVSAANRDTWRRVQRPGCPRRRRCAGPLRRAAPRRPTGCVRGGAHPAGTRRAALMLVRSGPDAVAPQRPTAVFATGRCPARSPTSAGGHVRHDRFDR
jgi:hypothetical protein